MSPVKRKPRGNCSKCAHPWTMHGSKAGCTGKAGTQASGHGGRFSWQCHCAQEKPR